MSASYNDPMSEPVDFGSETYPWPQEGDDPFVSSGGGPLYSAGVNFSAEGAPLSVYAEGYKRAADVLVDHVATQHRDHNFLVYPTLFAYRHYIELSLKHLIQDARRLFDMEGRFPAGHRLSALWQTLRPLMERLEGCDETDLDNFEFCLGRFEEVDPVSQGFRYPVDTNGQPTLPAELQVIDLRQVREVVERMGGLIDGASMQISVYLDYKADAVSEFGLGYSDYS